MQKTNFKGRCLKRQLSKCEGVCRTFSELADAYALQLEKKEEIEKIQCNVLMEGLPLGNYTSDFVCKKTNGNLLVRECVQRKHLSKPLTVKQLNESRKFWMQHGVKDWGIVIDCIKRLIGACKESLFS